MTCTCRHCLRPATPTKVVRRLVQRAHAGEDLATVAAELGIDRQTARRWANSFWPMDPAQLQPPEHLAEVIPFRPSRRVGMPAAVPILPGADDSEVPALPPRMLAAEDPPPPGDEDHPGYSVCFAGGEDEIGGGR